MVNYSKISTLNKLAIHYYKKNAIEDTFVLPNNWLAEYSIITKKVFALTGEHRQGYDKRGNNEEYEEIRRNKTTVECSLFIRGVFKRLKKTTPKDSHSLRVGDITNEFLSIFIPKKAKKHEPVSYDVDIDSLNRFIVNYCYPPVSTSKETSIDNTTDCVYVDRTGGGIMKVSNGKKKELRIIYPFDKQIEEYVDALQKLFSYISSAACIIGRYSFDVSYYNTFDRLKNTYETKIVQETINSILLYDASYAIKKYAYLECPVCHKHFFQNKKQKYCSSCKPMSQMTKEEMERYSLKSTNLSNDIKRNAYKKKLSRMKPKLTVEQKNEMLIEAGFAGLVKNKGRKSK